jgi:hypothetical protein
MLQQDSRGTMQSEEDRLKSKATAVTQSQAGQRPTATAVSVLANRQPARAPIRKLYLSPS